MTVTLYNIQTDPDHLVQTLPTALATYTGAVREPVSIDQPEITIQAQITSGNYVYISEFSRYYHITSRTIARNDLTVLTLRSDPCMSFSAGIKLLPVYSLRTSKRANTISERAGYNADIPDSKVQCEQATRSKNIFVASMPIQSAVYLVAIG